MIGARAWMIGARAWMIGARVRMIGAIRARRNSPGRQRGRVGFVGQLATDLEEGRPGGAAAGDGFGGRGPGVRAAGVHLGEHDRGAGERVVPPQRRLRRAPAPGARPPRRRRLSQPPGEKTIVRERLRKCFRKNEL
eukprot:281103-Pyramimonas_sp.AAC.1